MQPKTAKRRSAFRRANRTMPRRRIDIATEAIDYKNPDLLKKFVTESGKILASARHRDAGAHAPQDHARNQAQPFRAVDEVGWVRSFRSLRKSGAAYGLRRQSEAATALWA